MPIDDLPYEILSDILQQATDLNAAHCVTWTYGLTHTKSTSLGQEERSNRPVRYVRGPICADTLCWDSVSSIRQVCSKWHTWALGYSLKNLYVRRWRGSERWAELSTKRKLYDIYELIEQPSGCAVYRDPYYTLRETAQFFVDYPSVTEHVRRLWFNGFFTPEAEGMIFKVLTSCRLLSSISVPWTMLRHGQGRDWMHLLGIARPDDVPVTSLELQALCLPETLTADARLALDRQPLLDPRVDFSKLKRLKLFGNTTFMPVCDADLAAISRTATNLEEFHITCLSTVTIKGVMDIVKASQSTLRVLEHSPRSDDGFFHPDPGNMDTDEHICDILINCPNLRDLSISVPSMCAHLFSNKDVIWQGDCQVRAMSLCQQQHSKDRRAQQAQAHRLKNLLDQARGLTENQYIQHRQLDIELFFADCIFDPRDCVCHGDFALTQISANGQWPTTKTSSSKGPYGSTGLYGKDEGGWDIVSEQEYFRAVDCGWVKI